MTLITSEPVVAPVVEAPAVETLSIENPTYTAFAAGPGGQSFVQKRLELPKLGLFDGKTRSFTHPLHGHFTMHFVYTTFIDLTPCTPTLSLHPFHVVAVAIICCGVCYTDTMYAAMAEGMVVGHEIVGRVEFKGEAVTNVDIGDTIGFGYIRSTCLECQFCLSGQENMCPKRTTFTDGIGGLANASVWDSRFVYKIPSSIEPRHAGPLTCAGASVFGALYGYNISPTATIGVVGLGGLGHLAIKFAKAWGCKGNEHVFFLLFHFNLFFWENDKKQMAVYCPEEMCECQSLSLFSLVREGGFRDSREHLAPHSVSIFFLGIFAALNMDEFLEKRRCEE